MTTLKLPTKEIAGVTVPDTPLIDSAISFAKAHLNPMTYNHIMRSFLFGFILASKDPSFADRDQEVHAVSAILHDMGWDATGKLISQDKRFEVDGANAAREFLTREAPNWEPHRIQLVWDSIALHTTMSICPYHSIEAAACFNGISKDFTGPSDDANGLSKDEFDAVVRQFPRLDMADGIKEIFCGFCKSKPATAQDNIVGQIGHAYVDGFSLNNDWFHTVEPLTSKELRREVKQEMPAKKACIACRNKRRVLPECGLCVKTGKPCPGYAEEPSLFLNFNKGNFKQTTIRQQHQAAIQTREKTREKTRAAAAPDSVYVTTLIPINPTLTESEPDVAVLQRGTVQYNVLNALYFTAADFRTVYEALWNSFCSGYCLTADYWPRGFSQLALRSGTLDLALLALSARRMSFIGNPELYTLSVEAYGQSIARFRRQLEATADARRFASLACVSLIFTLFEGGSLSLEELLQPRNRAFRHLEGAIALMKLCDAKAFASAGLHEAFVKARELSLPMFIIHQQPSMFAEVRWMSDPWMNGAKSRRDHLYDIASRFASVNADVATKSSSFLSLDADLCKWQASSTSFTEPACYGDCTPRSCICLHPTAPVNGQRLLLDTECRSLQLLIDYELFRRGDGMSKAKRLLLCHRMMTNYEQIESDLRHSIFRQTDEDPAIMTEGRCRSVLPSLAVRMYCRSGVRNEAEKLMESVESLDQLADD